MFAYLVCGDAALLPGDILRLALKLGNCAGGRGGYRTGETWENAARADSKSQTSALTTDATKSLVRRQNAGVDRVITLVHGHAHTSGPAKRRVVH